MEKGRQQCTYWLLELPLGSDTQHRRRPFISRSQCLATPNFEWVGEGNAGPVPGG